MAKQTKTSPKPAPTPEQAEAGMVAALFEGSPEAVGVAVIRLDCGCRKMAAVDIHGEPASKIIMYRDQAASICPKCQADNGDFSRVVRQFISWKTPEPDAAAKAMITKKVLGD